MASVKKFDSVLEDCVLKFRQGFFVRFNYICKQ